MGPPRQVEGHRSLRFSMRLAVLLACVTVSACATPTMPTEELLSAPPVGSTPPSGVTAAILDATNAERSRLGLPALAANARLAHAAQLQADQCARLGRIEHVLPEAQYPRPEDRIVASGYVWQLYGENLALGHASAQEAVAGWMGSPAHRANIVQSNFTELGSGFAVDEAGRTYYVQVFGRPR